MNKITILFSLGLVAAIIWLAFHDSARNTTKALEHQRDSLVTILEQTGQEVRRLQVTDSLVRDSILELEEHVAQAETKAKAASAKFPIVVERLRAVVPDSVRQLVDSLQVTHEIEIAGLQEQIFAKDSIILLERGRVLKRDSTIAQMDLVNAEVTRALKSQHFGPTWKSRISQALPVVAATYAATKLFRL